MGFKINVVGPDGTELLPCSVEKATELVERGKAEIIQGGTAIRMFSVSNDQTSVYRIRQLNSLLTTENVFKNNLKRLEITGTAASGKTYFLLSAVKAFPALGKTRETRIRSVLVIYASKRQFEGVFLPSLTSMYEREANVTIDRDDQSGFYTLNRNAAVIGAAAAVKMPLLTIIPISLKELTETADLQKKLGSHLNDNYTIVVDEVVEPTTETYKKLTDRAVLTLTSRTTEDTEEVKLNAFYK
jgi:hypothetical protein